MAAKPLNWSQRVTMRMIADGRSPSGGASYLDTTGLGIPGATIRSLRRRGLIEPYSWAERGWVLTKAGVAAINGGECDDPDSTNDLAIDDRRTGAPDDHSTKVTETSELKDNLRNGSASARTCRVVLSGSMSALGPMGNLCRLLAEHGIEAVVPEPDDDPAATSLEAIDKIKHDASKAHMAAICDPRTHALLVVNIDRNGVPNYIGPRPFAEIAVAFANNQPIYLLQGLPTEYESELRAWGARCLHGDMPRFVNEIKTVSLPATGDKPAGRNAKQPDGATVPTMHRGDDHS